MTPFYDHDGITIYNGDALTIVPMLELPPVRAVIMDPPYSSGSRKEMGRNNSGAMVRGERFANRPIENDQLTTPGFVWLIRETVATIAPALIDGGHLLSFIDWRQWPNLLGAIESLNLRVNGMIVWDKINYGMGHGFRNQHELILHASRGTSIMADKGTANVLRSKREPLDVHPSPKPVSICEQLVRAVTDPGDLVVDPFMGAGPIAKACQNLGRRYIGIELVEAYCNAAVSRLGQLSLQL